MANEKLNRQGRFIYVRGVVQGVGFRPFVYRLAHEHGLNGWVLNHSGGVDIEVEGLLPSLEGFLRDLEEKAPPAARIASIKVQARPLNGQLTFEIRESRDRAGHYQLVSPDIATCADCLRELLDPNDRRYRYPFTNCTNCGPRFTIIADIPYDRPNTTMGKFKMCPECQREYDEPVDRRFHAQPNACPRCGPNVWLTVSDIQSELDIWNMGSNPSPVGDRAIQAACRVLLAGGITAIKGLGGFHLACDATNAEATARLRRRKGRSHKPLAVMMSALEEIKHHCQVTEADEELLTSRECPIVLLPWREQSDVARNVAPGYCHLGVMLPYTPLHHVLLRDVGRPLVMTSGNLSEEPICQTNEEARVRLAHIADAFLLHNRDIYARYDDSVWFVPEVRGNFSVVDSGRPSEFFPQPIRRSRGYAPYPITLPFETRPTLAVGAELKNTFCLTRDRYAFLSQHVGDMENLETLEHFETSIELLEHLFRIEPEVVAYDLHPEYLSTKFALDQWRPSVSAPQRRSTESLQRQDRPALVAVQHHHAHIASCLADNGWRPDDGPVIGVAWDGTGYGTDRRIWGGEWLVADYQSFQRVGHLEYLPLPGGEAAIREPWRIAWGYLYRTTNRAPQFRGLAHVSSVEMHIIQQQVEHGVNTPLTSSAGRLFDAVSALLGVRQRITYEAQAAIELEQVASRQASKRPSYPARIDRMDAKWIVALGPLFRALLKELEEGTPVPEISARFHLTMAELILEMCLRIQENTRLRTVALSGGCFQNRLLFSQTVAGLREAGFEVLVHRQVPSNDGGLSLGQAAIAQFAHGELGSDSA